ncbi:unnamed protein product [Echinostoma caproni]|uniref:Uncharacterized protein n=1 Tax=Echinostoma caproni TaxID=27848 RepID=A0A183BD95_9TREM|nr:unnamed protein product [Echinostoma caproni]
MEDTLPVRRVQGAVEMEDGICPIAEQPWGILEKNGLT